MHLEYLSHRPRKGSLPPGGATHIHTDSKSVFNQTNSKRPSGNRVIDLIKGKSSALVQHIYAHPEGRKLKQEWTHLEWGNHMADRVADRDPINYT